MESGSTRDLEGPPKLWSGIVSSRGSLLEMKILRSHPRPTESEAAFYQDPPGDWYAY